MLCPSCKYLTLNDLCVYFLGFCLKFAGRTPCLCISFLAIFMYIYTGNQYLFKSLELFGSYKCTKYGKNLKILKNMNTFTAFLKIASTDVNYIKKVNELNTSQYLT